MPSDLKNNQSLKRTISVARTRTTSTSEKDGTIHMKGSKTIYTAGRPPWYDSSGQMKEALVIGNLQTYKHASILDFNHFLFKTFSKVFAEVVLLVSIFCL
jgi:hypothetical protein